MFVCLEKQCFCTFVSIYVIEKISVDKNVSLTSVLPAVANELEESWGFPESVDNIIPCLYWMRMF